MATLWPEKSITHRKQAIDELVKGQEAATQLLVLLDKSSGDHGSVSAEELVVKILRSFTQTLSVGMNGSCESHELLYEIPATSQVALQARGGPRPADSGENKVVNRRGSYKKRKVSDSWVQVSPTAADGFSWRKYGQKRIINCTFPRCAHKHDRGCRATKQVQRMQEQPGMLKMTYFGRHSCGHTVQPSLKNDSDLDHRQFGSEPKISSQREEIEEERRNDERPSKNEPADPDACTARWADDLMMPLECPPSLGETAPWTSDINGGGSASSRGLQDMDLWTESADFENDFRLDEIELL
ncbi:WRKY DNA-binding transcription factor 70 isoform X2 [Diospyros lotus]|uniref:WRKY DNA-binding transcription factor 70 isoform X2 n=1 Tax=Diospyros lotus TaxID=55363 RepID=UPI0022580030|nr:WRKY DNA-binding transcription factor 70 isoform X2 [Diospyros lotus]